MERLTLQELALATGGRLRGAGANDIFERVTIDSRQVQQGDLFWAIKGDRHDGHRFVEQAFERGAQCCVIESRQSETIAGPALIVDDTLLALGRFASWYRNQIDSLVIGVTGSVGKTTTRELIYSALGGEFEGIRSRRNFNNEIGLPLSLLDQESHHEFAVIEMGASAVGNIRTLCEIARPEVGVITAIGPAHICTFGSIEAIVRTKGELLEELPSSGFAILPSDDRHAYQMAHRAKCPVIFVGQGSESRIRASQIEVHAGCLRFHCEGEAFRIPVTGRHTLSNALCAIAIGLEIGVKPRVLSEGLASFVPVPGRCGVISVGPWTVVDDTYNASPLAVEAACRLLHELVVPDVGQRMLILGDMCELGEIAVQEHERIGRLASQLQLDRLLVCGNHADDFARGAVRGGLSPHQIVTARDIETLIAILDCWLEPNAILLVKGSRVTRMERIVDWLRERANRDGYYSESERPRICA